MDKYSARKRGLENRASLTAEQRAVYDEQITSRVIRRISGKNIIGIYVSMNDEVDTLRIIDYCFRNGIRVIVPKTVNPTLEFYEIKDFSDLKRGVFGVMEPVCGVRQAPESAEIMFVPMSAYDKEGKRTGYGKGYYDSVLGKCPLKIGLAYPEQETDHIDTDPWDIDMDEIITAEGIEK